MNEDNGVDWQRYLADFHRDRAGVTEAVLSRAVSSDHTPYRWLARAVSVSASRVLDLACGAGAMSRELDQPGRVVLGLDISEHELALAAQRGPGPWVRGDARRLPVRDSSIDAVTSSMGLVVVTPPARLVEEAARVLRPGGVFAAIAPAVRPLRLRDLRVVTRLSGMLMTTPQFPGPVEIAGFARTFAAHGLRIVENGREIYRFTVRTPEDAALMLSALYLPNTPQARIDRAISFLIDELRRRDEVDVAIPMRRIVAMN